MDAPLLLAFLTYISVLIVIGLTAHKKHTSASDFMVGGRQLNFWVTALSAHASDMSSWLFMAFPMAVFLGGFKGIWIAVGLVGGMYLNWHIIAPRLRRETERYESFTLNSYLESRYADTSGRIRLLAAGSTIFFMIFYLAAGLTSMGFLFESLLGINYHLGISIASAAILAYTAFGGFVAVAYTDFFQALFLLAMIILVPSIAYQHSGGIDAIQAQMEARELTGVFSMGNILEGIAWGLGYFGLPHVLTKFMGISNAQHMYKAKRLGISWQILALLAAAAVGFVGIALYAETGLANPELVFVEMVRSYFHPFIAGLILCGVLAATISTMDSQILVASSTLAEDIYKKTLHPGADSKRVLTISRLSVAAVTLLALMMAFRRSETIYSMVFYAWSGLGCSFGPVMLASLLSSRVTGRGAFSGMIVGVIVAMTWKSVGPVIGLEVLPTLLVGFVLSLASIGLVSCMKSDD